MRKALLVDRAGVINVEKTMPIDMGFRVPGPHLRSMQDSPGSALYPDRHYQPGGDRPKDRNKIHTGIPRASRRGRLARAHFRPILFPIATAQCQRAELIHAGPVREVLQHAPPPGQPHSSRLCRVQ